MLKTIKSAIKSIALASTIIFGAILAPELHNHYLRFEVGDSVVQVLHPTKFGGGTGFAVKGKSGKEYIMTNKHVCGVLENGIVRIEVDPKHVYFKKVIYEDTAHDLCLIEGIKGLAPLSIGSDQNKGDYLYVVGHPGLRQLTTSVGEYIGRRTIEMPVDVKSRAQCLADGNEVIELPPLYQMFMGIEFLCIRKYEALSTSAVIYGGNSGSPVVNRWGNLIGVAFAGSTQQERDNYLVPLKYVKAVLNKF